MILHIFGSTCCRSSLMKGTSVRAVDLSLEFSWHFFDSTIFDRGFKDPVHVQQWASAPCWPATPDCHLRTLLSLWAGRDPDPRAFTCDPADFQFYTSCFFSWCGRSGRSSFSWRSRGLAQTPTQRSPRFERHPGHLNQTISSVPSLLPIVWVQNNEALFL